MNTITTDFSRDVIAIAGLPFDNVTLDSAYNYLHCAIESNQRCFLTTPNLNFIISAQNDIFFRNSVLMSDLVIADGMPIVWLSKFLSLPISTRVAGSNLFEKFLNTTILKKKRVFFFGGPDGAGMAAQKNLENSNIDCCGFISPGFRSVAELSSKEYIDEINNSSPDFLIVALGAKKGQEWIVANQSRLTVPVISHLGAVINFVAGNVSRAPQIVQNLGLEWLWRIKEEPALWKRYYTDGYQSLTLFLKRILPLYRYINNNRSQVNSSDCDFFVHKNNDTTAISLRGNLTSGNLQKFRNFLIHDYDPSHHLEISCSELLNIDSAGIGLLMLLFGHQLKMSGTFKISNTSKHIDKILFLYSAEYLLTE